MIEILAAIAAGTPGLCPDWAAWQAWETRFGPEPIDFCWMEERPQ